MRQRLPPIPGRFWWAEALCAMAGGVGAIAGPVWYLSAQLPLDKELGRDTHGDLALAAVFGLAFLLFSAFFIYFAARELYRWRMRRAALLGNDAIPLARGLPTPSEPPDVSQQPLELLWRAAPGQRFFVAPMTMGIAVLELALCFVAVIAWAVLMARSDDSTPFVARGLAVAGAVLVVVVLIAFSLFFARVIPTFFGRPFGVTASDGGLECRTAFGRRFTLAWGEARLFEVEQKSSARLFYLYGPRVVATWRVAPASSNEFVPAGISGPEMSLRLDALNALIVARTGLAPRTFTRSLAQADQARRADGSLMLSLIGYSLVVLIALGCFAMAVVSLVLPPNPVGAPSAVFATELNVVLAVAPAVLGAVLLIGLARLLVGRLARRRSSSAISYQPQPVVAPPPSSPDEVYSLQDRLSAIQRIGCAAFGLIALTDLVPIVALFGSSLVGSLAGLFGTHALPINSFGDAFVVYCLLAIFGVCGLYALKVAWRGTLASAVYANKTGISVGGNRFATAIPWAAIDRITARSEGQSMRYVIYGARTRIGVRDNPRRRHLLHALPGTSIITPGELAALASERSGKSIEWT